MWHATLRQLLTITAQCADSELILTIADDGIGLAESPPARDPVTGMGLRIMRYRAEHIGGTVRIDRCSPRGTAIRGVLSSQRRNRQHPPGITIAADGCVGWTGSKVEAVHTAASVDGRFENGMARATVSIVEFSFECTACAAGGRASTSP
jgi:hypothetical protein